MHYFSPSVLARSAEKVDLLAYLANTCRQITHKSACTQLIGSHKCHAFAGAAGQHCSPDVTVTVASMTQGMTLDNMWLVHFDKS